MLLVAGPVNKVRDGTGDDNHDDSDDSDNNDDLHRYNLLLPMMRMNCLG